MNRKILFLASRFPFPVTNGRDKTLTEYLSFFKDKKVELLFCYFGKEEIDSQRIKELSQRIGINFSNVVYCRLPSLLYVLYNVFFHSIILKRLSLQESLFFSSRIETVLDDLYLSFQPDIIICDMIRSAQYFQKYRNKNVLKIFDMDDILSRRYKYLSENNSKNIIGNFSKNLPKFADYLINNIFNRRILNLEAKLVQKREVILSKSFDKVILVSPKEADILRGWLNSDSKVFSVYPSAEYNYLIDQRGKEAFSICFMGLLNVPHNEHALMTFFENIFPSLITRIPQIRFYIIGGGVSQTLLQYQSSYPDNVKFTGFVDDYSVYLLKSKAFIAPIYFGTGIKLKILDAMALGLPVVTTSIGAEGLIVRNNTDILIRDDYTGFIEAIYDLLNDDNYSNKVGENAQKYIREYHDYHKLRNLFLEILEIN
ncbi:glycosyltransferase [Dehalobacter sp. CF]|jgi:Glycosyltransferase|uniref:glycosyltransferase n=1 Tax=Dehalobacter sp. CF TaxID=1131462 RepID=UPI00028AD726|nr:glycosyltransferase [Dehalobacter sp. CF]AFV05144.1 glycosyl transferase, group 1 [Dehalobacter sp. CF]